MAEFNDAPLFSCRNCRNPIALRHDLLSKSFIAKSGQAYMFAHAMNVVLGQTEDKKLMTGLFSVGNIYCSKCGQELGWKYIRAYDAKQSFKEGRFIIEKARILKEYST
ncbi:protein yippee-like At4g27740 isoform X2 [Rhododendron vialii]|nr:protein yippee-like At4g27740 isoform X2 [Rhododendron vialii]XP_058182298.1 protein yippee-like At4g27740 isoform X2 [Rhododendron vialii]